MPRGPLPLNVSAIERLHTTTSTLLGIKSPYSRWQGEEQSLTEHHDQRLPVCQQNELQGDSTALPPRWPATQIFQGFPSQPFLHIPVCLFKEKEEAVEYSHHSCGVGSRHGGMHLGTCCASTLNRMERN